MPVPGERHRGSLGQIGLGRFDTFLRKLFNVKGVTIAPQLDASFQGSIDVESQVSELQYLRDVELWAVSGFVAALAANFSQLTLQNNGTNVILVVDGWAARDSAGITTLDIGFDATPAGATAEPGRTYLEGREVFNVPTRRPLAVLFGSNNVGSALTQGFVSVVIGASYDVCGAASHMPFVLAPSQRLIFQTSVVNRNLDVLVWGRARPIEKTEAARP